MRMLNRSLFRVCVSMGAVLALLLAGPRARAATLYDELGGAKGVRHFVDVAIHLYQTDPRLAPYFDNFSPDNLAPKFARFVCHVADGGCLYRGRAMGPAHRGLHIDEKAFNAVVEDFQAAMRDSHIPYHVQNRLLARLAPYERVIVSR